MDRTKKIEGVSLIESLVCLVIIGIGFIGFNQMISYATTSIDRSVDANKINFLSETAVEDIMGDANNASKYSFSQQCTKNYNSTGSLAEKVKVKWAKHFMQENQLKINNKLINEEAIIESLMCFKRAGASAIVSYFAIDIAKNVLFN